MKQAAVEWIIEQINNVKPHQFCSLETIKEWCEQAKAMEKEQIIDAYLKDRRGEFNKMLRLIYDAKKYYTETYESKTNL
jgi:uncharacterized protein YbaP (TraB family)